MHVEQCPTCQGNGKVIDPFADPSVNLIDKVHICHGCQGKGFIQVYDAKDMEIMMNIPELKKIIIDQMEKALPKDDDEDDSSG